MSKSPNKLAITLRRSTIGCPGKQKETARSLGFRRLQQTIVVDDSPVVRGMIHQIKHLVEVRPADAK